MANEGAKRRRHLLRAPCGAVGRHVATEGERGFDGAYDGPVERHGGRPHTWRAEPGAPNLAASHSKGQRATGQG